MVFNATFNNISVISRLYISIFKLYKPTVYIIKRGVAGHLGLWCLMPLSTVFQLYHGGLFYWWRKPKYPEKTTTCRKSLTNYFTYCCIECTSPWERFEFTTLVVIGTDYAGSCKSNYHVIATTMASLVSIYHIYLCKL